MTVPSTSRRAGPFNGNGAATAFPFYFKILDKTNIQVVKVSTAAVQSTLVLDSDYSVAVNADQVGSPGGTVTYPISGTPLATGETLSIIGALPYSQTTSLPSGGSFDAGTLETAYDKLAIQVQQLAEINGRTLTLPAGVDPASVSAQLPVPSPTKLLGWNATAQSLQNVDPTTLAPINLATAVQISAIASGTGAVTRTVQDKLRETVSVRDFGATGLGVASDTATFTAAAAAFHDIEVNAGTFLLRTAPTLTGAVLDISADAVLTGAGATALGYTSGAKRQLLQSGTSGSDFAVQYTRRNADHTGGTAGFVSSGIRADIFVGSGVANYEWAVVGVMDNSATAGQNVGGYLKGIRRSTGPTWGGVSEVVDKSGGNPGTGAVGLEVDVTANGTDTSNNRIGIDIVVRKDNAGGAGCAAGFGVRLQNAGDTSSSFSVGFDTSHVTIGQAAFKMAQGQTIAFDANAKSQLGYDSTGLFYSVSGTTKSRLNDTGGIELFGLRTVLSGSFSSGAVTPTLGGVAKPGVSNTIANWLSVTIDGGQYWIPIWNN